MMTIAGRFVTEADDRPDLFVAIVCTIRVPMVRGLGVTTSAGNGCTPHEAVARYSPQKCWLPTCTTSSTYPLTRRAQPAASPST
ncbi:MAG: hypothetical protein QOE41_4463 [Mycobacterium sp.]|jgi:hypothetical protein|nr:hypothetical protein [Mycobacterium sp.]MDT5135152.1 hypothetical protein [Mycobacterium sp.]